MHYLALLDDGRLQFNNSPERKRQGDMSQVLIFGVEYDLLKERYSCTSTIPSAEGWRKGVDIPSAIPIAPNLDMPMFILMDTLTDTI